MKTIDAINLLTEAGYIVRFSKGCYQVVIEKLVYTFTRIELVELAKSLLYFA